MQTKVRYSLSNFLNWSKYETSFLILYNVLAVILYYVLNFRFMQVPWTPVALIGTAVAFLIGFQSNAAYNRIWEARTIWGSIVNSSRTWGMKVQNMVTNEYTDKPLNDEELRNTQLDLIYRHLAWLTTLRYAMRETKKWEEFYNYKSNREFAKQFKVNEREIPLEKALESFLNKEELQYVLEKGNKSTAVLFLQSKKIQELKKLGLIWDFSFLELENLLEELFDHQGKSERIKNFPYPKQFSSLTLYVNWVFIFLLPFGLMSQFDEIGTELAKNYEWGHYFIWTLVPFTVIVSWVFWIMQRVSLVGDNPFEGTGNDVPISTISRGIEIDLLQQFQLSPDKIPSPYPDSDFQL